MNNGNFASVLALLNIISLSQKSEYIREQTKT